MAITKTKFINYTRCPRFAALDNIKNERLSADITYQEYIDEELNEKIAEFVHGMYDTSGEIEEDLIDVENRQLQAMLKYYLKIEELAAEIVLKKFGGKVIFSKNTSNQECFDFTSNGIRYLCYVDVFNECEEVINIIEVKATTTNKYLSLGATGYDKQKHSIFEKIDNCLYLKDEIGYDINSEMDIKKYQNQKSKLFDRFKEGKYVYDLSVQRFFIEEEHKQSGNIAKLPKFRYYLGVLNHEYIFDGTYELNEPVYKTSASGEEIITLIDLTKVTQAMQEVIKLDKEKLERYVFSLDAKEVPLSNACEFKKQTVCKYFNNFCGKHIPKYNSSLNYMENGFGFDTGRGRMKGLDLINNGYLEMLDIPEDWINRENHFIQRNALRTSSPFIDHEKINDMLNFLEYPIYHLDFETFPCPLPRFFGEKPYTQSPFEFSLHIEKSPGVCDKDKDNYVFLASSFNDEREELVKKLLEYIDPNKGTLFAQNVAFEKARIKELANIFPQYRQDLLKISERAFDLIWILKTKSDIYKELGYDEEVAKRVNYYDYRFSGSYSIKKTLPVFSDLKYDCLEVKNGTEAIVEYANYPQMSREEFNLKYKALVEYCKQDTWAMVVILDALRKCVNKVSN